MSMGSNWGPILPRGRTENPQQLGDVVPPRVLEHEHLRMVVDAEALVSEAHVHAEAAGG